MAPATIPEYAVIRSERIPWSEFTAQNDWAEQALQKAPGQQDEVPESCTAIYYVVDKNEKTIVQRLYAATWLPTTKYQKAFRDLNWAWVERLFKIEQSDIYQLEHPQETIINPGGEIFFLECGGEVIGTVALVVEHGDYELAKMSVSDHHQGKGYSHLLMNAPIDWARQRKLPGITILSSQSLVNAVNLYKKYGFETVRLGPHPNYERCDIIMRLTLDGEKYDQKAH